ncbi:MAG: UDP-3-O-(3-hydroxymyristoyl)glucosamine N-acyltransferase [Pseudomonadota bacterium]
MADPDFFQRAGPFRLSDLAEIGRAEIAPAADADAFVHDVASLESATETDISFFEDTKRADLLASSKAGFCAVRPADADKAPNGMTLLISKQPQLAYALIAAAFYPEQEGTGVDTTAHVDASAIIDPTVTISAGVVVGARVHVGQGTRIGPNTVIGDGVRIGADCRISSHCSLSYCVIGDGVAIDAGVRIGERGFGWVIDSNGHSPVPQLGRVIIEDRVSIGANTTIDRGSGPDTLIRQGAIIDNQVMIGHNVEVGESSVLVSQVGIAGSTKLGPMVMLGGKAGLSGHLSIGAGARIMAKAGVYKDVPAGADVAGSPAIPVRDFWRLQAQLKKMMNRKGD